MNSMKRLILCIALLSVTVGCKSTAYVQHPGSVNLFDSQTYDVVLSTHAVIEETKTELDSGAFASLAVSSKVRTALNSGVVPAYNALDVTYLAYHTAVSTNASTPTAPVTNAINAVNMQLTLLNAAKAGQ